MNHLNGVMFDLETLGREPGCVILSFGGVRFDVGSGKIHDELYVNIDPRDSKKFGLTVDPETVEWWKSHPQQLKESMTDSLFAADALGIVYDWFKKGVGKEKVWSWGSTFDVPILQAAMKTVLGVEVPPWKYWDVCDARTVQNIFNVKIERGVGHHNALTDAKTQASYLINLFKGE